MSKKKKSKNKHRRYVKLELGAPPRLGYFTLEQVLPHIGKREPVEFTVRYPSGETSTFEVNMDSTRAMLLGREQVCRGCGVVGTFFCLEWPGHMGKPHFNLYGYDWNGQEILLTMDHIKPQCAGGSNSAGNLQLLCHRCNGLKGSKKLTIEELQQRLKRRQWRPTESILVG